MSFWEKLPKPFFVLAPLADVTDAAFRRVIAARGKPDVLWTEFVSADGLVRATEEGRRKLLADLLYTEAERPIVAQLFSGNPEYMERAARLCKELGFDGIDINMGCPDRSVEKQGAGAACIRDPENAVEIIRAAKRGADGVPVSVKTRLGYNQDTLEKWLPIFLAEDLAAITIHARTRKEMSKVPARWERIKRAVEIRDAYGSSARIIGNGDMRDLEDARAKARASGADGVMLGRAIFGNPWLFRNIPRSFRDNPRPKNISVEERLRTLVEHTTLFERLLGEYKSFSVMKKHYKAYVTGFDGAAELRAKLMEAQDAAEIEEIVANFLKEMHS